MDNSDVWNLNEDYLKLIMQFITHYNNSKFECNYQNMFQALQSMETTLFPEKDGDDVEANLKVISKYVSVMEVRDYNGEIIKSYPNLIHKTVDLMNETYRLLLLKMKQRGMLVKINKDPSKAMGNFGGS